MLLMGNNMNSIQEQEKARKQLEDFAITSLKALIHEEKQIDMRPLTLSYMTRMDIGLVADDKGTLSYYVNEVTRIPNACLFAHGGSDGWQNVHTSAAMYAQAISDTVRWQREHYKRAAVE